MDKYYQAGKFEKNSKLPIILVMVGALAIAAIFFSYLVKEVKKDEANPRLRDIEEFTAVFNEYAESSGIYLEEPISYDDVQPCDLILRLPNGVTGTVNIVKHRDSKYIAEICIRYTRQDFECYMADITDGLINVFAPALLTADARDLYYYSFEEQDYIAYSYDSIMQDCRDCDEQENYYKYIDNIYDGSTDSTKLTISSEMNNAQAEKMILLEVYRVKSYK